MAWLSGWSYRKEISITGQSGAGTEFQVSFSIGDSAGGDFHLEGHCTNFPQDIAVTDNDGTTLLDFWIEDIVVDPLEMWIKVADDLGSNQTIYVYYGKSGATTDSNGTDTFLAFFDGDSTGWTEVDPNSHITFQNNRLEFAGLTRGESAYVYKAITPIEVDWIAEWTTVLTSKVSSAHVFTMGMSEDIDDLYSHSGDSVGFDHYYSSATYDHLYIFEVDEGSASNVSTPGSAAVDTRYMEAYRVDDIVYVTAYSDAARTSAIETKISKDITGVTPANLDNYFLLSSLHATGSAAMTGYVDDHKCRKYLATEPAFSSAGSEETPAIDTSTDLLHGKIIIKDSSIILVDGLIQVKDSVTDLFDGEIKVIEKVTSLADGKLQVQDVAISLADGKLQVKDSTTGLADGKVQIQDIDIDLADGNIQIQDTDTSLADGLLSVQDKATDLADGKVQILDSVANLADGKVQVQDVATSQADGKVQVKDSTTGLADGKVQIQDIDTDLADGKVIVTTAGLDTDLADGKIQIKDVTTGIVDGIIKVKDSVTGLVDGKLKIGNIDSNLADGLIRIKDTITGIADGKVQIKDVATGLTDGKVQIQDSVTNLADGKVIVSTVSTATGQVDGKIQIKDVATGIVDGLLKIVVAIRRISIGNLKPSFRLITKNLKPTHRLVAEQPKPSYRLKTENK